LLVFDASGVTSVTIQIDSAGIVTSRNFGSGGGGGAAGTGGGVVTGGAVSGVAGGVVAALGGAAGLFSGFEVLAGAAAGVVAGGGAVAGAGVVAAAEEAAGGGAAADWLPEVSDCGPLAGEQPATSADAHARTSIALVISTSPSRGTTVCRGAQSDSCPNPQETSSK
jgi:hypothetical protein